jgi:GNAT superfamily N-acetyltransferase
MIRPDEVLALYDAQIRKDPVPDPGSRVERVGSVVRVVGTENYVLYAELNPTNVQDVVRAQAEYFRNSGMEVEWKTFGHDPPEGLPEVLAAEGFVPDAAETLVVLDLTEMPLEPPEDVGIVIRPVTDASGLLDARTANAAAFGPDGRDFMERWSKLLGDPNHGMYVAYAGGSPVATGRVEMPPGRAFAGLWGGGTVPAYRHRGIYRRLVAARAAVARARGYRFLTVDALETSRPILERLGFVPLASTRGWVLHPKHEETADTQARPS